MATTSPVLVSVLLLGSADLGFDDSISFVSPGPGVPDFNPAVSDAVTPTPSSIHVAWTDTNASRAVAMVSFKYDGRDLVRPFDYVLSNYYRSCLFITHKKNLVQKLPSPSARQGAICKR